MGIAVFMSVTFAVCFVVVYIAMRVSCFLKKQYCNAENWFCKLMLSLMCESCRESCYNHRKLFARAIMFAFILAAVITFTAHYVR